MSSLANGQGDSGDQQSRRMYAVRRDESRAVGFAELEQMSASGAAERTGGLEKIHTQGQSHWLSTGQWQAL